ncbi:MAG: chloride channel protein [Caldilineales bacterium]
MVAGVGAGISATYFAQLAAIFFALEIVLGGFGGVVFVVPTLIAVASASMFIQFTGGAPAQFDVAVAGDRWFNLTMLLYVGVAIVASLAAIAYVNLLPRLTAFWARRNLPYWLKTALAGVLIGLAAIWIPGVTTNGQDQMREIFAGAPIPLGVLLALATATVILAPWSLGGGYVGGVIGPALVIGSALGAAYGDIVAVLLPGLGVSPQAFAMVATAAMLAGTLHAPLFGAMMIFEMANDYRFLVPLLLASAVGYGLARPFQPGSAYTFMLPRAGLRLTRGTFILAKQARGKDADVD